MGLWAVGNWGKYSHRGTSRSGAAAVTLVSACWAGGGTLRLVFSEPMESYGTPVPANVTVRHTNSLFTAIAVASIAEEVVVMVLDGGGVSIGANFVTIASGGAAWLRSALTRVPLTAPVTQASAPDC